MRQRYIEGKIQGLVFRTLDRLSRNQTYIAVLLDEMEYYKIKVHCVKEEITDDPIGKFVVAALALVAEMEREKSIDRTNYGRISKAKEGKVPPIAKVPYGRRWVYAKKNDKVVHDYIGLVE